MKKHKVIDELIQECVQMENVSIPIPELTEIILIVMDTVLDSNTYPDMDSVNDYALDLACSILETIVQNYGIKGLA